ncbi:putative beta-glucosidase 18-like, partial [Capsicum annuum]
MQIHFPVEIIVEILIRLPVQSLLRFKCSSKSWNTLILDPYFMAKHYNHAKNNKKFLIARMNPEICHISYYCSSLSSAEPLHKLGGPSNHDLGNYVLLSCSLVPCWLFIVEPIQNFH